MELFEIVREVSASRRNRWSRSGSESVSAFRRLTTQGFSMPPALVSAKNTDPIPPLPSGRMRTKSPQRWGYSIIALLRPAARRRCRARRESARRANVDAARILSCIDVRAGDARRANNANLLVHLNGVELEDRGARSRNGSDEHSGPGGGLHPS